MFSVLLDVLFVDELLVSVEFVELVLLEGGGVGSGSGVGIGFGSGIGWESLLFGVAPVPCKIILGIEL